MYGRTWRGDSRAMRKQHRPSGLRRAGPGTGQGHGASQRPSGRAVLATVAAAALGFSASLFPLPATFAPLDALPPQRDAADYPTLDPVAFAKHRVTDASTLRMSDLIHLTQVLDGRTLDIRTDTLVELVNTYGLRDVVRSLEMLQSIQAETRGFPVDYHGSVGTPGNPDAFPELLTLLEYMLDILPGLSGPELAEVLTNLLPVVVNSLRVLVAPGTSPMQAQAMTLVEGRFPAVPEGPAPPVAPPVPAPTPTSQAPVPLPVTQTQAPEPLPVEVHTFTPTTVETTSSPTATTEPAVEESTPSPTPEPMPEPEPDPEPEPEPSESHSPPTNLPDPDPDEDDSGQPDTDAPEQDHAPAGDGANTNPTNDSVNDNSSTPGDNSPNGD